MTVIDPELKEYATDRQKEYIDKINEVGSQRKAAESLGIHKSAIDKAVLAVKKRAARAGYAPGHWAGGVAPGYRMGKVTVQRGPDGVERTWERQHPDQTNIEQTIRDLVANLIGDKLAPITDPPSYVLDDMLAVYAFGDPHFGMRATAAEAGEDFDLQEASRVTKAGIDGLVSVTPPATTALLLNVGDNTHANDGSHKTPAHGNALDMDGSHNQSVLVSALAWVHAIRRMLEKHQKVVVWFLPGNHDPDASFAIAVAVSLYFHSEPRVTVDLSTTAYRYLRFGRNLIGAHHGHGAKPADLPLLMAVDRPEDWGATEFRYVWIGHIHHDTVKEVQGVRVESLRTLAAKDAWHAGKGYRSLRDTRSIVIHKDYGEIGRHVCSIAMLRP